MPLSKIIVVGAGPSGLLLALLLARAGITVELVEMSDSLDKNPRATHYSEPSCYELDRAGVLNRVRAEGFSATSVSWRKLDEAKTRLVALHNPVPKPGEENEERFRHRMAVLPLDKLGKILESAVFAQPTAKVLYHHKVTDIGQDDSKAWIQVTTPDGDKRMEADYVVGCDGANSKIRQCLFGEGVFPGHTWDEQIVATNVYYDFGPYDYDDSQFFIHPEHWHMVAKITPDGMYRISYGELGGLNADELRARLPMKFKAFLPGSPDPEQYKVVMCSPYKVHQRCVDKMRIGRFLLAADAAHLCNPFGGMGLTGGIADIGSLYDSFLGIHNQETDDSILDKYDEIRRKIWHSVINPVSSDNMRRLIDQSADDALSKDPFLKMLKQIELGQGPKPQAGSGAMALRHDMTEYFKTGH